MTMEIEKHGDDLLRFRILGFGKPASEVTSGKLIVGSKSAVNDFREVKPVSSSLEGSNTKALKPPPLGTAVCIYNYKLVY